jgi:predicted lipoprotein with Yx(FWY)xxD motif
MKKHLSMGLSAFALAALLSGCAGTSGTGTSTTPAAATTAPGSTAAGSAPASTSAPAPAPAPAPAATDLKVADSTAGRIVVDGKGMSVYFYAKDVKGSGRSACTGGCLQSWPPVLAAADTPTADGVTGTVGTIATPAGKRQLTINGMPVYYYAEDQAAGDILGQGVGGVWSLVTPSGEMVTAAAGY